MLLLNGLAVLCVVLHHAAAFGFQAMFDWTHRYREVTVPNYDLIGSLPFYALIMVRQLDQFALPAFMFVSGYFVAFMAGGDGSKLSWKAVWPRARRFVAPFIIWSLIFIVLIARPNSIGTLLTPYYYIPLVIQYYLISPLIVPLARRHWKLVLVAAAVIQLGMTLLRMMNLIGPELIGLDRKIVMPQWLFPNLFFWFVLGIVIGLQRQRFAQALSRARWVLLVGVLLLASLTIFEYVGATRLSGKAWLGPSYVGITATLYALAFILCFLAFSDVPFPLARELSDLGTKSLGVYLANIPAMYVFAVVMYRYFPGMLGNLLLYLGVLIIVGLGGPLLIMSILRRSAARGAYRYVFG
ncbi:MAG: acyltransferase [Chloroflexota bacterium]|nr:MAG: acyltransferase [Chloroflexota bacterium]